MPAAFAQPPSYPVDQLEVARAQRQTWLYGQPQARCNMRGHSNHRCWCGSTAIAGGKWCSFGHRDREELDIARTVGLNISDYHTGAFDLPDPLGGIVADYDRIVRDTDPHWMKR